MGCFLKFLQRHEKQLALAEVGAVPVLLRHSFLA